MKQQNKTIVVLGATGQQGKGVVSALKTNTDFRIRAITRNPDRYQGDADEVVSANLNDTNSLAAAFENAWGVFVVTNFWEPGTDELSQAKNAIDAAKSANVSHFIWSTLPNVKAISQDKFQVPHFTDKAAVDSLVASAGFQYHSFVVAAFFYQNLISNMPPSPQPDGTSGWALPINPSKRCIHMTDISELGDAVAGAFTQPELAGNGQYLPVVGELLSFEDVIAAIEKLGTKFSFREVPAQEFAHYYEGAAELAEMFGYFSEHSYMGGAFSTQDFQLEQKVSGRIATSFAQWAARHW